MSRSLIENIIFVCVAGLVSLSEPAIRPASAEDYHFTNFIEPIQLSRGTLAPIGEGAQSLDHDETCKVGIKEWGWLPSACDAVERIVVGGDKEIDNVIVGVANHEGFVKFDDWSGADEAIDEIWNAFVQDSKGQGERLHQKITPINWYIRPTLEKSKQYLFYAILTDWDGERVINVKATKFDRYGYITFALVPTHTDISPANLQAAVERALHSYTPKPEASYTSYVSGDKVAAAGAVGVLATLVGVKYGKAAAAGAIALGVVIFKKLAFFLLVLPVMFIKRLFRRSRGNPSA